MAKHLRIALIGRGRWGRNIEKTLRGLSQCTLAYVAERDYRALIAKKDIDAVIVATPGSTHARVALPFIKRSLPVFIEKPLTTNLRDAGMIKKAAEKSGSLIFVGHLHHYNPAYLKTKELIQKIGKIRFMVAEGSNNGPYRNDMSALWDWAPHDIYMMVDLVGSLPKSLQAWGVSSLRPKTILHDIGYIKLNFKNGVTGFIFNSWLFPEKRKKLTVVGEKSSIVFDDTASQKVTLYKNMGPQIIKKSVIQKEPKILYPKYDTASPLTAELKAFISAVQNGTKPKTGIQEGLTIVKTLDAAEKSIKSSKLIRI
ncbi:MAG: Gfo/Idh/MocA family oxidoreductase [bacterium]|nr:Gfo/Idh/MocA family oxidoreductase [bacterium]